MNYGIAKRLNALNGRQLALSINGTLINTTSSHKYLGVNLDSSLNLIIIITQPSCKSPISARTKYVTDKITNGASTSPAINTFYSLKDCLTTSSAVKGLQKWALVLRRTDNLDLGHTTDKVTCHEKCRHNHNLRFISHKNTTRADR